MALLLQASPLAMGVIHKHQKTVTSQVSDTISETIGLLLVGGHRVKMLKCKLGDWDLHVHMTRYKTDNW